MTAELRVSATFATSIDTPAMITIMALARRTAEQLEIVAGAAAVQEEQ
jgi:hypothetical protein